MAYGKAGLVDAARKQRTAMAPPANRGIGSQVSGIAKKLRAEKSKRGIGAQVRRMAPGRV